MFIKKDFLIKRKLCFIYIYIYIYSFYFLIQRRKNKLLHLLQIYKDKHFYLFQKFLINVQKLLKLMQSSE